VSVSLARVLATVLLALTSATCASSHEPVDPRPPCPEGDDFERGNECTQQSDCEESTCGRVAGLCVEYKWVCGQCDFCFFDQVEHIEDTFLPCNPATGFCEYTDR
jgi:hypothetical protein